jgi:hypothetical protein
MADNWYYRPANKIAVKPRRRRDWMLYGLIGLALTLIGLGLYVGAR